jgi:hypothetical protein
MTRLIGTLSRKRRQTLMNQGVAAGVAEGRLVAEAFGQLIAFG